MKNFILSIALIIGTSASANIVVEDRDPINLTTGKSTWVCRYKLSDGTEFESLNIEIEDMKIKKLNVAEYAIIKDGKKQPDDDIGQSVFNVTVGDIKVSHSRQLFIKVNLQDYSDVQSFAITLIADSTSDWNEEEERQILDYQAVLISNFYSSDGDSLLHTQAKVLNCQGTSSK